RDLRSWNVHRKLRLALAVGCANHERSLARRTVRVHTDDCRLCADGRTLRPLFTFLTFLARRSGFTFVAFLAFLARRSVFTFVAFLAFLARRSGLTFVSFLAFLAR